jgi:glycerophosphoryl diester phosphodiesterase
LLSEVINAVQDFIKKNNLPDVLYNIEIKSEKATDNIFHPEPKTFAKLVRDVLKNTETDFLIQSFDVRILKEIHYLDKEIKIGLLSENKNSPEENIKNLGFNPFTYNPYFELVNEAMISELHLQNIQIWPWTVNEISDIKNLISMGVDGIITDYPDRAFSLINSL